ncbi:hypothetical protein ACJVDH_08280 [Pedobacter sp. AW1-32]|uniref:hypothetical protein n=1 Tax=Pedobacter sp. AW1-32 TaxID=3383026 RepID=UPI003FF01146
MPELNLVMSLKDFYHYIQEIIEKNGAIFYSDYKKDKHEIGIRKAKNKDFDYIREKFLSFYILTQAVKITQSTIYDDDLAPFVILGEGGRTDSGRIERINLRILSKKPEKRAVIIFNAIKNKLKKDDAIAMGVKGGSRFHENYFYQKEHVGKKMFITDFHNDLAPVIEVL